MFPKIDDFVFCHFNFKRDGTCIQSFIPLRSYTATASRSLNLLLGNNYIRDAKIRNNMNIKILLR